MPSIQAAIWPFSQYYVLALCHPGGHFLVLYGHLLLWVTEVYSRVRSVFQTSLLVIATGVVQRADAVVSVLIHDLQSLHPRRTYHDE
jgi:hypothetical protein